MGGPEKEINDFVKDTTEGLIKDIISPGMFYSCAVLYSVMVVRETVRCGDIYIPES